jgi:hypothetical protein
MLAAAIVLSLSSACRPRVAVPAASPAPPSIKQKAISPPQAITPAIPAPTAAVKPIVSPIVAAAPNSFDLGEASFRAKNYAMAARSLEDYLKKNPASSSRDMVLFRLGLSLELADNSDANARRAEETLKRLVVEFPESPYSGPAKVILGLQSRVGDLKTDLREKDAKIKQLSEELQKLKEIDMQRRPSGPP